MDARKIKVLVADPNQLVGEALRDLFLEAAGTSSVQTASTAAEAVETAGRERPDLVVIDAWMAHRDSDDVVRKIVKALPGSQVVVMATRVDEVLSARMLSIGAVACVEKDSLALSAAALVDRLASR